jgi:alpha-ketoglutarate-dependent taurine dioxygenase
LASQAAVQKSYALKNVNVDGRGQCWLDKDVLYLHCEDGTTIKLPYVYLRDFCQCLLCKDQHSHQRPFRTNDIPKNVVPRSVKWNGANLVIQWANDVPGYPVNHKSEWALETLREPRQNPHEVTEETKPVPWSGSRMEQDQHWVSYEDFAGAGPGFARAMCHLQSKGLIFVKDIPESREMVEKIATGMGPLRNTFYGSTFDVRTVPNAQNVAYTNTFLGFHMDLMYMNEPPGYQLLHCLENSCKGGESMFADAFHAAETMRNDYRPAFNVLSEQRLGYEYRHENSIYYNERPVFELDPRTKEMRHVNYSPPFQSALPPSRGTEHDTQTINKLQDALSILTGLIEQKSATFELKLNPGECAIFDNRRIVHARRQFDSAGGARWLAGAYVDTDALLSCFAVAQKKFPAAWKK